MRGGYEKYGTVIKSGYMKKTVTVRVFNFHRDEKYMKKRVHSSKFLVHDEEEICRIGDKVVIKGCLPVSSRKYYYIRNLIWMVPRQNFYYKDLLSFEKRAIMFNQNLRKTHQFTLADFNENDQI